MSVRYLNATGTQALIDTIKQRLATKADQSSINSILQQVSALAQQIPTKVSQLNNDAEYVTKTQADEDYATSADINSLATVVTQNQEAINLLNADNTTPGSVDYKIDQALSAGGVPLIRPISKADMLTMLGNLNPQVNEVVVVATGITDDSGNLVDSDLHTTLTRADYESPAWVGVGWADDKVYTIRAFVTTSKLYSEGVAINPDTISASEIRSLF